MERETACGRRIGCSTGSSDGIPKRTVAQTRDTNRRSCRRAERTTGTRSCLNNAQAIMHETELDRVSVTDEEKFRPVRKRTIEPKLLRPFRLVKTKQYCIPYLGRTDGRPRFSAEDKKLHESSEFVHRKGPLASHRGTSEIQKRNTFG